MGTQQCAHCRGTTTCSCGTCGTLYTRENGEQDFKYGICKVCSGTGRMREQT